MCFNVEAAGSSKWYLYETMQHHILKDHNLSIQHIENHKTHINIHTYIHTFHRTLKLSQGNVVFSVSVLQNHTRTEMYFAS